MDDADRAMDLIEQRTAAAIAASRAEIPPGEPGECRDCEEDSPRLIHGLCARCRDKREKGRR